MQNLTVGKVYANPAGRDALDKMLMQLGWPTFVVNNPIVGQIPLRVVGKLAKKFLNDDFTNAIQDLMAANTGELPDSAPVPAWWQSAVFYQVYPRSFQDSDGDGFGDIAGITSRLDYLKDLGVDCLWLSPIFESPGDDNGYDISDYRAVDPEMGTMAELEELIAGVHERGMRIILDLVVNHTSDRHPWFQAALADPDGEAGQWYFLRDDAAAGEPGTKPPNNWTSFFSGSAWKWFPEAKKWALHLFAPTQMDLNWDHAPVRREVADIVQWWLAKGVDGFRLDVINYISKQANLPAGSKFIGELMTFTGVEKYYSGPHLHEYLAELRANGFTRKDQPVGAEQPGADARPVMIGETPGIGVEVGRMLTHPERGEMDLIFNFDHLETPGHIRWDDYQYDLNFLKKYLIDYQRRLGEEEWMSLFFENHDNPRMVSKVNPDPKFRSAVSKALATILLGTRGVPFIYQGQEIASANQDFPNLEAFRDIESINYFAEAPDFGRDGWQALKAGSRDHARTPMRWEPRSDLGFTAGVPWISPWEQSTGYTVAEQTGDANSPLEWHRRLIQLRRDNPNWPRGHIAFWEENRKDYFAWLRGDSQQRFFFEINLSDQEISRPALPRAVQLLAASYAPVDAPQVNNPEILLPYEARIWRVR
ncbi:MAG: alpha-glucosidase [Trueperella sp.]|nr:alpha-glucosidase [Trueperella sp.]